jgi:hypothetical protein
MRGCKVIYLILGLLMTAACLIALLWAGTYFFQGYIYTEPSQGLYWQAPAAGALMAAGFAIWCFTVALYPGANPSNIPIHVLHKFSAKVDMFEPLKPARKLWAIKSDRRKTGDDKDGEKIEYDLDRVNQKQFRYLDTSVPRRPWNSQDVIAVEIKTDDGSMMRFDLVKTESGRLDLVKSESSQNRRFRSSDGWEMVETTDGPTGNPERFLLGRLIWNIVFNLAHLAGWFIALCLILRFQWGHALGLAVVLWLIFTLALLPMMLDYAAIVAEKRQSAAAMQPAG